MKLTHCPHCGGDLGLPALNPRFEQWQIDTFNEYWALYPRKVAKASALKAWKRAATSEAIKDEIMAGLHSQLKEFMRRGAEFIPHASTYLNGRRWEDETRSWVNSTMSSTHQKAMAEAVAHDSALTDWERTELDKLLSDAS